MRPNYTVRNSYLGDGSTTQFSFGFKIVDKAHLLVLKVNVATGATIWQSRGDSTTYFTTTISNPDTGLGYITISPAIPNTERLVLLLADDMPTQPANFAYDNRYSSAKIEASLDRLSGQLQRMRYLLDRSFKLPEGFTQTFAKELNQMVDESVLVFNEVTPGVWVPTTVPRSDFKGDQGIQGDLTPIVFNPVAVDVDYDDEASVVNTSGDPLAPVLQFTLRAGPQGPQGESTVLVTASADLPDNGIGSDGDMWFLFDSLKPEHGNVYQKAGGVYGLVGNIKGPPGGVVSIDGEDGALVYDFVGYSGRFNQAVNVSGLRAAIALIFDFQYLIPLINSFSGTGSGTLREKGATVTNPTLSVTYTKRTDNIGDVRFYDGASLINTQAGTPGGGTTNHNSVVSFTDNKTFNVQVDDVHSPVGTASQALTYSFVYALYRGVGAPSLNAAGIAALTKEVVGQNNNKNIVFTLTAGQVPYYAFPSSHGDLTSILDENGFESISGWTKKTGSVTNTYGLATAYTWYERNTAAGVNNTTNYTFKR